MTVFFSTKSSPVAATVNGIGLDADGWAGIRQDVLDGGSRIIKLRGRSSFQSPGHQTAMMVHAAAGGSTFEWPCGAYLTGEPYCARDDGHAGRTRAGGR